MERRTALIEACLNDQKEIVELLLSANADIHKVDREDRTALFAACHSGNKEIVELLLARGADINKADIYGHTPLSFALTRGHTNNEIIDLLLDTNKAKVNMNHVDDQGVNILFGAVRLGSLRLIQLFLANDVCL